MIVGVDLGLLLGVIDTERKEEDRTELKRNEQNRNDSN